MTEVLSVSRQPDGSSFYSSSPLRRSHRSQSSFFLDTASSPSYPSAPKRDNSHAEHTERLSNSLSSSAPSSLQASYTDLSQTSFSSASASTLSLEATFDDEEEEDEDEEIAFPTYDDSSYFTNRQYSDLAPSPRIESSYNNSSSSTNESTTTTSSSPDSPPPTRVATDDTAIRNEPSRHVDYLSHDWREEDIWSSWRHIVSKRKFYGQRSRLENASWRTWAKSKYHLRTVSPETLNWLKESDVTWLYGPLQTASSQSVFQHKSPPPSALSKSNSFLNKKPILKKRSMSEVMLQRSISASSLLKQAAAAVQAQQSSQIRDRPILGRAGSDFVTSAIPSQTTSRDPVDYFSSQSSSGPHTPGDQCEKRHIRFDDKVEQCIAVEVKDGEFDEEEEEDDWTVRDDEEDSDDGIVMMKRSRKTRPKKKESSRSSSTTGSKTIEKLPSTRLKYRTESPEVPGNPPLTPFGRSWSSSKLSPSPSQETLRPSHPSTNFLVDDEDDVDIDMSWEPSGAFSNRRDSVAVRRDQTSSDSDTEDAEEGPSSLRRTPSGMFMPYEEDEDDVVAAGLFGKVVDTVNTAKDIGHVIWNVGWRK
ncbi:hypothetical protein B0A49_04032 [Cryomyces minteri]|uniref:Nitrogen regulatory protein areA GATA-like domain-containing protein n=1 Tax=Cryomyces minteri TaxID=331657 RepID=A0A4U0XEK2_9PEZI|nr:hypothetical protein B0A49_04032 [Cryomyces minteri]